VQIYASDAAVVSDQSVQGLIQELYDPDLGGVPFDAARPKEVLNTRAALTDFLAGIIYTCSAGHSVVNYGQVLACMVDGLSCVWE
jgi:hypothetical protein